MTSPHVNLRLNLPKKVFISALICELVLVGIYLFDVATASHFQTLHSLFDLDSEGNIPAWFSSSQLFCVAIAFWSCAVRKKRPSKLFFALAGLAAVYASSDETAQIHERVTALMGQRYVDWLPAYAAHNFLLVMVAVALLLTVCQFLADDLLILLEQLSTSDAARDAWRRYRVNRRNGRRDIGLQAFARTYRVAVVQVGGSGRRVYGDGRRQSAACVSAEAAPAEGGIPKGIQRIKPNYSRLATLSRLRVVSSVSRVYSCILPVDSNRHFFGLRQIEM